MTTKCLTVLVIDSSPYIIGVINGLDILPIGVSKHRLLPKVPSIESTQKAVSLNKSLVLIVVLKEVPRTTTPLSGVTHLFCIFIERTLSIRFTLTFSEQTCVCTRTLITSMT